MGVGAGVGGVGARVGDAVGVGAGVGAVGAGVGPPEHVLHVTGQQAISVGLLAQYSAALAQVQASPTLAFRQESSSAQPAIIVQSS